MSTGGSFEHDDVVKAPLRLDRPEIRSRTNFNKAILVYYNDPDTGTHNEMSSWWLENGTGISQTEQTTQEENGCCEDGETTTHQLEVRKNHNQRNASRNDQGGTTWFQWIL